MEDTSSLKLAACRAKGGAPGFKVAILGAAGGIGQPLAMLMKMNPLVSVLHLYDVVNSPGVTVDISHMDTGAVVCFSILSSSKNLNMFMSLEIFFYQLFIVWNLRTQFDNHLDWVNLRT